MKEITSVWTGVLLFSEIMVLFWWFNALSGRASNICNIFEIFVDF